VVQISTSRVVCLYVSMEYAIVSVFELTESNEVRPSTVEIGDFVILKAFKTDFFGILLPSSQVNTHIVITRVGVSQSKNINAKNDSIII
jgi:hypothetical protein